MEKEEYCKEGMMNLRNAIVERAFDDYALALRGKIVKHDTLPEWTIDEIEYWAIKGDMACFTNIDGRKAIMAVRERTINDMEEENKKYKKQIERKERKIVKLDREKKTDRGEEIQKNIEDIGNIQRKILINRYYINKIKEMEEP